MKDNNKISTKEFWTEAFADAPKTIQENDPIKLWIDEVLDYSNIKNCIEIGCYPGKYLTIFGDRGIEINGLDYIDDVVNLNQYFRDKYNVGQFINADVFEYVPEQQYDCVMSFGLIEHFLNWEELVLKHTTYVSNGGYLILEVPNFSGWMQRLPRFIFDKENYKIHNLAAMNLNRWVRILEENNFTVIDKRYFGGFKFWYENNEISSFRKFLRSKSEIFFWNLRRILYPHTYNSKHFSSYMGIIVKKGSTL